MAEIQDFFLNILSDFSGFLWGVPMIVLLFGTHLFLTFRTGGNALMAIPNIISLLLLSGVVASETKKYLNKDRINEYDPTIEH